jgi:hypothetical protein
MRLFKRAAGDGSTRSRRTAIAIAAVISSVGVGLIAAAPAQAANPPSFWIYYSPGCGGANHFYLGANSGERWINDTFNASVGSPGYGQKVAYNAASVFVSANTWLTINYDSNQAFQLAKSSVGRCVDLPSWLRNYNQNWADGS